MKNQGLNTFNTRNWSLINRNDYHHPRIPLLLFPPISFLSSFLPSPSLPLPTFVNPLFISVSVARRWLMTETRLRFFAEQAKSEQTRARDGRTIRKTPAAGDTSWYGANGGNPFMARPRNFARFD